MADAAANLKTILTTHWDSAIIDIGEINDNIKFPLRFLNNGICLDDELADWHPAGYTHQQTDAMGKDVVRAYLVDSDRDNVRKRAKAIAKVADNFNHAGGDSNYDKLYPHMKEIVILKSFQDELIPDWLCMAELPIECVLNNKNLYT